MSLLTIAQQVAKSVGTATPTEVFGGTGQDSSTMLSLANEVGEELARRVDWGQLTKSAVITGDGTEAAQALPADFHRIVRGVGVDGPTRPLTRAEWNMAAVEGVPRYFLLEDMQISLWPYLTTGATLGYRYQSKNWCDNSTAAFGSDDDSPLMNEDVFAKGLEVRWRRQKGMDYLDQEAEFESALVDYARFNDRSRL